jgi:hypothetical protein
MVVWHYTGSSLSRAARAACRRVGVYDLQVGRLEKGRHSIELTVADDGKGNAAYQWDALSLIARNNEENREHTQ